MNKRAASLGSVGLALALAVVWLIACSKRPAEPSGSAGFRKERVPVEGYSLFDLGVVDVDGDGNLDLFTANHNARQTLTLGDGHGEFRDALGDRGLSHDPHFPAAEDTDGEPALGSPGLYIYWFQRKLHVRARGLADAAVVAGQIAVTSPITVRRQEGFKLDTRTKEVTPGLPRTTLRFAAQPAPGDRLLVIRPRFIGVPVTFELDARLALQSIRVGARGIAPRRHRFSLFLKDRHGLAWTDWSGDGRMDVFIARGGLKGEMKLFPESYRDELLRNSGGRFEDATAASGIAKQACRARQAAWVDFDRDGWLDLYINCRNGPGQLYQQLAGAGFTDVAGQVGLEAAEDGSFVWLDADADGDPDLFVARREGLSLHLNQGGRFDAHRLDPAPGAGPERVERGRKAGRPTVADYDTDGDLDIFVACPTGNTLLENTGGQFKLVNPEVIGLPARALTANWVDFDNDGLPDLHLAPGGLYRQQRGGRFAATGWLDPQREAASPILDARCTWADFDNDGSRDLLMAVLEEKNRATRRWTPELHRNRSPQGHWLQVSLIGPPGNRQAIGARVALRDAAGRQVVQQVGTAEGSHYSQGHYRLYFGLGNQTRGESLRVTWPDGKTQELPDPPADRRLEISYQPDN